MQYPKKLMMHLHHAHSSKAAPAMYTLDPALTGSVYEKSGRVVQNWNFLINFINFEAELQDSAKKLQC